MCVPIESVNFEYDLDAIACTVLSLEQMNVWYIVLCQPVIYQESRRKSIFLKFVCKCFIDLLIFGIRPFYGIVLLQFKQKHILNT